MTDAEQGANHLDRAADRRNRVEQFWLEDEATLFQAGGIKHLLDQHVHLQSLGRQDGDRAMARRTCGIQ